MSDDWQKGDLALCVRSSMNPPLNNPEVVPGSVSVVERVNWQDPPRLLLKGRHSFYPTGEHQIVRFRKIKPLSKSEHEQFLMDLDESVRERV